MSEIARIYRPAKNAMQSGRGKLKKWVLEYSPSAARFADPLMGWTGSSDMNSQVTLKFDDKESAIAFCEAKGIEFQVIEPKERKLNIKAYADNFASNRVIG
ncbi:ETC complex I subunit [Sneathiella limimaris]|uniref:ETC complex I subunit n=1 Tax=Sneathiella limimaris TaxID=1964213 RepID=UPI00146D161C|nr:ETC complex I subunit [Sneathiella limimaris]